MIRRGLVYLYQRWFLLLFARFFGTAYEQLLREENQLIFRRGAGARSVRVM